MSVSATLGRCSKINFHCSLIGTVNFPLSTYSICCKINWYSFLSFFILQLQPSGTFKAFALRIFLTIKLYTYSRDHFQFFSWLIKALTFTIFNSCAFHNPLASGAHENTTILRYFFSEKAQAKGSKVSCNAIRTVFREGPGQRPRASLNKLLFFVQCFSLLNSSLLPSWKTAYSIV